MVLDGEGKLLHYQVEAAVPWWEVTLKGKDPDFDTPDPNEGEFRSATDYFGLLLTRPLNVQHNVREGALKALYDKISAINNIPEWNEAWNQVFDAEELEGNQNDTPEAVLNHITNEYKDLYQQYGVAWVSEHLGVTYSFALLAMHQIHETTGNDMSKHPKPNPLDRMSTIKFFANVIKPSHPILIKNIHNNVIPTYLLRDKPVKPVEPKPVEPKPVEKKEEEKGGSSSSSLWFIVILVMAIILMNSYER